MDLHCSVFLPAFTTLKFHFEQAVRELHFLSHELGTKLRLQSYRLYMVFILYQFSLRSCPGATAHVWGIFPHYLPTYRTFTSGVVLRMCMQRRLLMACNCNLHILVPYVFSLTHTECWISLDSIVVAQQMLHLQVCCALKVVWYTTFHDQVARVPPT